MMKAYGITEAACDNAGQFTMLTLTKSHRKS